MRGEKIVWTEPSGLPSNQNRTKRGISVAKYSTKLTHVFNFLLSLILFGFPEEARGRWTSAFISVSCYNLGHNILMIPTLCSFRFANLVLEALHFPVRCLCVFGLSGFQSSLALCYWPKHPMIASFWDLKRRSSWESKVLEADFLHLPITSFLRLNLYRYPASCSFYIVSVP